MNRALFYDNANKLALRPYILSKLKKGQCMVRMMAAAVHPADKLAIAGRYPRSSSIAGNEGVGQVMESECDLSIGQKVIVTKSDIGGTWAEKQVFDSDCLFPVPDDVSLETAATLRINPGTAFQLLSNYKPCKNILLSAANSQVGQFLYQLRDALFPNVNIVGLVQSQERLNFMRLRHPRHKFYLQSDDWMTECKSWDTGVALDCVGGDLARNMLKALPCGSTLCTFGAISGEPLKFSVEQFVFEGKKVEGFWVSEWFRTAETGVVREMLNTLCELAKAGKLAPIPLEKVAFESVLNVELKSNHLIWFN